MHLFICMMKQQLSLIEWDLHNLISINKKKKANLNDFYISGIEGMNLKGDGTNITLFSVHIYAHTHIHPSLSGTRAVAYISLRAYVSEISGSQPKESSRNGQRNAFLVLKEANTLAETANVHIYMVILFDLCCNRGCM